MTWPIGNICLKPEYPAKPDYPDDFSHIRLHRIIRQNFRFSFLLNGLLYTEFRIRFIPKRIAVLEYPVPFKRNE